MPQRLIVDIKVGKRYRRDLGDVGDLAMSIADVGLLHPVVINPDGKLIAGQRRIAACKSLGWDKVPVTEIDLEKIVRGEYAENAFRKSLTPEEKADIADAVEPIERAAAQARLKESPGRGKKGGGISPTLKGRSADKVGKAVGMDRKTLDKARAVRDAAKENPKKYGKLLADMNRTGNVSGPHKRLKVAKMADQIRREPPPLPDKGPYRVIVADPPWAYEVRQEDPSHRAVHAYSTMSIAQICALDVGGLAHKDCILWLWTTNHHMREAFTVLDVWGFEQKTILTWAKDRMGTGDWLRGQTEHCIMAVRGKPTIHLTNQTTLLPGKLRKASQKPVEFYPFIEKLCPAPRYAELFSTNIDNPPSDKWDCHGENHHEKKELLAS